MIPKNLTGKALYDFVVKNEALIIHAKKSAVKFSDSVYAAPLYVNDKGEMVSKAELGETVVDPTKIKVVAVINTTNYYDSHGDVHLPNIWKKSISDNKKQGFYLLDSHQRAFDKVITEGCQAATKTMAWSELGITLSGTTEALIFTGIVEKERNPFMFDQYYKKYVKMHSVGMRYLKMCTCINDDDYPVQKENWDKFYPMVANKDDITSGMFWAVLEAQIIEGSAVLFASNCMTPTIEVSDYDDNNDDGTDKQQPPVGTVVQPQFNIIEAIKKTTFI